MSSRGIARERSVEREASALAAARFRVFPLHRGSAHGCSCERASCGSIAKHPRIMNWRQQATCDLRQVGRWWRRWPDANIGLATGAGLVVVDLDSSAGDAQAAELGLPETPEVRTGRGRHLYYEGEAR